VRRATLVVSAGRPNPRPGAGVNPPISWSSTYRSGGAVAYARDSNPVWEALEAVVGELEGGHAVCFSSGMAAIAAVVESFPAGAVVVVAEDCYNGTRHLLHDLQERGRIVVRTVDQGDHTAVASACQGASLLWLESPTNPLLRIADLRELCRIASECSVVSAVDNTFATPLLQRPLELGADLVVHSATKYLSGHSDALGGVVVSRDLAWRDSVLSRRSLHGAVIGPVEAFLVLRGIRTLAIRMERAQANAAELARRLSAHPKVCLVRYPGLPGHPGHELAARQMDGFGAMLSFEVGSVGDGQEAASVAEAVCSSLRLVTDATSLGGVETLAERRKRWDYEEMTPPGLIRVSVGIEDVEDLWEDFEQALGAV